MLHDVGRDPYVTSAVSGEQGNRPNPRNKRKGDESRVREKGY
jgi:hypothetical protein